MIENNLLSDKIIRQALEEDIGAGDLTSDAIIGHGIRGTASLIPREKMVLAGRSVFSRTFEILSSEMEFEYYFKDGDMIPAGEIICVLSGPIKDLLKAERTALNFLQRMSGIATLTRLFVDKAASNTARVLDTRKTAPGLRLFDKYAVRMGGGFNHRFGLSNGILIKDNHIKAAGNIARAVSLAREKTPHGMKLEVEVEDLAGVEEAIRAGADIILLDNMSPDMMKEAVDLAGGKMIFEASGNVSLDNISGIAKTGVSLISVGALTHSARAMDVSLELNQI